MTRLLKLVHLLALVRFLGSVLTYIVISSLTQGADVGTVVFGRRIIATGTRVLTLPGVWLLAVTGVWMGLRGGGLRQRFFQIKAVLVVLVLANTYLFILPAEQAATDIATASLAQGTLSPAYADASLKESVCGGVNILLALAAAVVGVWKFGMRPARAR